MGEGHDSRGKVDTATLHCHVLSAMTIVSGNKVHLDDTIVNATPLQILTLLSHKMDHLANTIEIRKINYDTQLLQ